MIGLEVIINGEMICTAAIGEVGVLTSVLSWVGSHQPSSTEINRVRNVDLRVGGLTGSTDEAGEYVDWVKRGLGVGDRVEIRIVDVVEADEPMERRAREREPSCSFCSKMGSEVSRIIAAQQVNICDECVEVCNQVIANNQQPSFGESAV